MVLRRLPPDLKKSVKEALRALVQNPDLGEPLRGDLEGLWKYRVRRYRIVYRPDPMTKKLQVFAFGHRREIYDSLAIQ
ncbi:MAG TPA: cytotoxin [Deltaproteobacteria bacterium]|nr:cytotoxin [Deltaproteobacteria bacterium]